MGCVFKVDLIFVGFYTLTSDITSFSRRPQGHPFLTDMDSGPTLKAKVLVF